MRLKTKLLQLVEKRLLAVLVTNEDVLPRLRLSETVKGIIAVGEQKLTADISVDIIEVHSRLKRQRQIPLRQRCGDLDTHGVAEFRENLL